MASLDHVKKEIARIAERGRNNVTVSEIERVVNQLSSNGYTIDQRKTSHGVLFQINGQAFHVCTHHRGSSQVKACYVKDFIKAMIQLELYDDD